MGRAFHVNVFARPHDEAARLTSVQARSFFNVGLAWLESLVV